MSGRNLLFRVYWQRPAPHPHEYSIASAYATVALPQFPEINGRRTIPTTLKNDQSSIAEPTHHFKTTVNTECKIYLHIAKNSQKVKPWESCTENFLEKPARNLHYQPLLVDDVAQKISLRSWQKNFITNPCLTMVSCSSQYIKFECCCYHISSLYQSGTFGCECSKIIDRHTCQNSSALLSPVKHPRLHQPAPCRGASPSRTRK